MNEILIEWIEYEMNDLVLELDLESVEIENQLFLSKVTPEIGVVIEVRTTLLAIALQYKNPNLGYKK